MYAASNGFSVRPHYFATIRVWGSALHPRHTCDAPLATIPKLYACPHGEYIVIYQEPPPDNRSLANTSGRAPTPTVGPSVTALGIELPSVERKGFLRSIFSPQQSTPTLPVPAPKTSAATYDAMCDRCSDPSWLKYRGPAYDVLKMHSDFINPPFQQVHAIPKREFIASNYKPDHSTEELYYVNGMRCCPHDVEQHLSSLVKTFGKPVTAIINDQECDPVEPKKPGFFTSVWHGICGLLSANAGYRAEPEAVGRVEHAIKEHVQSGKPLHLIAHSQGSIIVGNALERLLGPDSPLYADQKAKVLSLVRVSTFGAAEHYFPAGVRVQEYAHHGDKTASVTSWFTDARETIRGAVKWIASQIGSLFSFSGSLADRDSPRESQELQRERAPVVYLEGEHDFGPFLDKVPEFFIKQSGGGSNADGSMVAHALTTSVTKARLSDLMHGLIIREMIHRGDREFAKNLLDAHPTGAIGEYTLPFMSQLRTLAQQELAR